VLTLDDGFVHARAALDVVALDRQELLQRVGSAVGFHRPNFHFTQALTAELRFAAERLLGSQGVRADRPSVDLVVDQVVELEHVHHAHGHILIENLAGTTVEQDRLARSRATCTHEHLLDVALCGAVEHGGAEEEAFLELAREGEHFLVVHALEQLHERLVVVVDVDEASPELLRAVLLLEHGLDLTAEFTRTPTEVRLEDLPDVHAARHAQRVQHDVDRSAVFEVRHVLFRQDAADHTLVAVTTGHLVADLQLALDGDVHLHHLDDARGQLITTAQAVDLLVEVLFAFLEQLLQVAEERVDLFGAVLDWDFTPMLARHFVELSVVEYDALVQQHFALVVDQLARGGLATEDALDLAEERVTQDLDFLVALPLELGALLIFD